MDITAPASLLYKTLGKLMGEAIFRRMDNDARYVMWGFEGRDMRICECGRQYKRLGWARRHFQLLDHSPNIIL